MIRVLVSACLLGEKVRYNGKDAVSGSDILRGWLAEDRVLPFCPEVAGGLGVPRPPAEIQGGRGEDVIDGKVEVKTRAGDDVTAAFVRGARGALAAAVAGGARLAVLKEGSPSCGSGFVYDGTFSGVRREDRGGTAALLERHGIRVFSDLGIEDAAAYLRSLEGER